MRELESFGLTRDPENYALALYGKPGEGGWGWRIEGHHLSLHFSLEADRYVATLPQFFGANPAVVPRDVAGGPRAGFRLLGSEEDTARQWLMSLSEVQRQVAVIDKRPYGDILSCGPAASRRAAVARPSRRSRRVRTSGAERCRPVCSSSCQRRLWAPVFSLDWGIESLRCQ